MKTKETAGSEGSACTYKNSSMMLRICICLAVLLLLKPCSELKAENDSISPWSILMAENLMDNPSIANGPALQYYVFATALKGLRGLWEASGDTAYFQYISAIVNNN